MSKINKTKVLLITPNIFPLEFIFQKFMYTNTFPLALACLASFIKQHGYEVKILDAGLENLQLKEILTLIQEYAPDVVGINSILHNEYGTDIIKACKKINPRIVTVLGGLAPTFMPFQIMEHIPELDFIIRGEGEMPFLYLLRALEGKFDLVSIKGLVYRKSREEIASNEGGYRVEDLNTLPIPAKDVFITKSKKPYFATRRFIQLEASRGCYYNCKFCVISNHFGKGVRYRNVKLVVDEIQSTADLFGINFFAFCDNTFTANSDYVNAFIDEIMKRGIYKRARLRIMTRIDCVNGQMLKRLKKANCFLIGYGIESPSQETVNVYNKGLNLEKAKEIFDLTKRVGIAPRALFIFNQYEFPHKAMFDQKIQEVISFLKLLKPVSFCFSPLVLFPNSPMYDEILASGAISPEGYRELFKRNYLPSRYLSRDEIEYLIIMVYSEFRFSKRIQALLYKNFKPFFCYAKIFRSYDL